MRSPTSRRGFGGAGPALVAYNVLAYAFLLAPIAVVIVLSFTSGNSLTFPPPGLSLRWFRYLAGRDEFLSAALVSTQVAALAAVLATGLAIPAALALVRGRIRFGRAIETLLMSPAILPGIVIGVALLQYFTAIGLVRSFPRPKNGTMPPAWCVTTFRRGKRSKTPPNASRAIAFEVSNGQPKFV